MTHSNAILLAPPRRPGLPQADAPNYVLRRMVALVLVALTVVLLAVVAASLLAGFGGGPAAASEVQPVSPRAVHVAQPGDSLWSIAREHRGDVSLQRYVDRLVDLNGGTTILAGQAVRLP